MSDADTPALLVGGLVAGYDAGLPIVQGVDLAVYAGEIVVVVGPNGAGKSTLVKALAGAAATFGGSVHLFGRDITAEPAHRRAARGVGYVPQVGNVFVSLSVEENLRVGGHLLREDLQPRLQAAYERFPDLARLRAKPGQALSGGQRQMLAIARALMMQPRVLLIDEPSAGLAPRVAREVFAQARTIAGHGVAVLMVEQNVKAALGCADRGVVMVAGRIAASATAAALREDPALPQLFLGGRSLAAANGASA